VKEYVVRYRLNGYIYESVVKTSSSNAALLWVSQVIGGYSAVIVSEPNEWYEKVVDP
jgi:hypothetical protein